MNETEANQRASLSTHTEKEDEEVHRDEKNEVADQNKPL